MKDQDQHIINQIVSLLDGRASNDEVISLQAWITQSKENQACYARIKNIYEMSGRQPDICTDTAFQKVLHRITPQRNLFRFGLWLQRAAAVLFIPLLTASIYYYVQNHKSAEPVVNYCEMRSAIGLRSSIILPDNTRVWLNSGSKIRYPDRFTTNERTVYMEGEAYFEVTSSMEHPFVVNTPTLQIRATGTKFHVADFEGSTVKEVSLMTGKVSIAKLDDNQKSIHLIDLYPGQHLEYDEPTFANRLTEGDLYKYYAWKDNKIVFRNDPMTEVVKRISQLYGVEIELQGEELKTYRYRATFEDESLYEILRLLKLTAPINYQEVKRVQLADGTYTRPKIVIFPVKQTNKLMLNP